MFGWFSKIIKRPSRGERGETLATGWLQRERGFSIVARNWRSPRDRRDEIDLVAKDGEVLVFVEVKARATGALVGGYHAIDRRKKAALRRAVESYLAGLKVKPITVRFDVVEVALRAATDAVDTLEPEIHHFANVALFPPRWRPRDRA